jgi:YVTN family beta-propeller protein
LHLQHPIGRGPLLAVSRTELNKITLIGLDEDDRELATIPVRYRQPFGLAFDEARQWLYAACWNSARIIGIDLRTGREERSFPAARLPAWASRRAGTDEIWISSEGAGVVTIYHTRTGKAGGAIPTGRGPSGIVFTDSGRRAWITNEKDGNVSLIDAEIRRKIRDIPVGRVPQGIALTTDGSRLLVANFGSNTVSALETASGRELAQIPVGEGPIDIVTLRLQGRECAWVTCFRGGCVEVIDVDRGEAFQRIAIGGKPQGLAAHPNGQRMYVSVRALNELVVLSTGSPGGILQRTAMDGGPSRMTVAPQVETAPQL